MDCRLATTANIVMGPHVGIAKTMTTIGRNDPCPCGSGRKYKNCCMRNSGRETGLTLAKPERGPVQDLHPTSVLSTERVMADVHHLLSERDFQSLDEANAFIQRTLMSGHGQVPRRQARTALDRAQDLMYDAWEEPSRVRRVALARKSLDISGDCADAYVLLAQEAPTAAEAEALYAAGCAAGERALGPARFSDDAGHFWGLVETRPYMRARLGLANSLYSAGRHDEAVAHYRELLRLNPGDNQGVRYLLAAALSELHRDEELSELLDGEDYRDDASAAWLYTRALVIFRREHDRPLARKALAAARRSNPHVAAYLTGARKLPRRLPDYIGFGDESEAIAYAAEYRQGWQTTQGGLAWLEREAVGSIKPRKRPR